MAHFAELNSENIVQRVVVVNNDVIIDENGDEQESLGVEFLQELYGESTWKQCSYNGNSRGRYPLPGTEYIPDIDVFAQSPPYPSWVLNRSTGLCEAPVAKPDYDETTHFICWDEENLEWIIRPNPPEYDPETQRLQFDEDTLEWSVLELTEEPDTTN